GRRGPVGAGRPHGSRPGAAACPRGGRIAAWGHESPASRATTASPPMGVARSADHEARARRGASAGRSTSSRMRAGAGGAARRGLSPYGEGSADPAPPLRLAAGSKQLPNLRPEVPQLVLRLSGRGELIRREEAADLQRGLGTQLQKLSPELADLLKLRLQVGRLELAGRQKLVAQTALRLAELLDDRTRRAAVRGENRLRLGLLIRREVQGMERDPQHETAAPATPRSSPVERA